MVDLVHPNLPGRVITVHEDAVHHHVRSGWQRRDTVPQPEPRVDEADGPVAVENGDETLTDPAVENAETAVLNLGLTETR